MYTMIQARTNPSTIWIVAFGFTVVLSGCSDPRFKQKQQVRDVRMARYLNDYAAHDENLTRTCGLVRALHERDVRRWKEEELLRKARIEAILRGKPDEIDDTYAKMVY
jgi:hypothetical protein